MANLFAFTYEEKKRMAAQTATILEEEIGLKGDAIQAVYLIPEIEDGRLTMEQVKERFPQSVAVVCGRYACNPDHDCRSCKPHAADS